MMPGYSNTKFLSRLTLLLSLILVSFSGFSQYVISSKTVISEGDTLVLKAIKISDINAGIEVAVQDIKQIEEETKPDANLNKADCIYYVSLHKLNSERDKVLDDNCQYKHPISTNIFAYKVSGSGGRDDNLKKKDDKVIGLKRLKTK